MTKLILIGAGGHSKVIQDIVSEHANVKLFAIIDDVFDESKEIDGVIYSNFKMLKNLNVNEFKFFIAIGDNAVRKKIFKQFKIPIEQYITLIHPSAIISKSTKMGFGNVVMPNVVINANTVIGNHCIINTNAIVEHDNTISDYVHISPSATLAGTVTIEEGTHIGINASIIPLKNIGSWTTIGAGAVVTNDITNNVTAVGIPAEIL